MNEKDLKKFSDLARIGATTEELKGLLKDIDGILSYVAEIQEASHKNINLKKDLSPITNTLREDSDPHEKSKYTKVILGEFSQTKDGFLKVKKVL